MIPGGDVQERRARWQSLRAYPGTRSSYARSTGCPVLTGRERGAGEGVSVRDALSHRRRSLAALASPTEADGHRPHERLVRARALFEQWHAM
eukprot:2370800-Rhodomonas_salina.2